MLTFSKLRLLVGESQEPVAHTCNPSYLGGRDREDCDLRLACAKKSMRPHLNRKKLGVVACACYHSYVQKPKIGKSWSRLA
jgi:hypothetical protein